MEVRDSNQDYMFVKIALKKSVYDSLESNVHFSKGFYQKQTQ
jgi:hypothetical protein